MRSTSTRAVGSPGAGPGRARRGCSVAFAQPAPDDTKASLGVVIVTGAVVLAAALQPTTVRDYCAYGAVSLEQLAGCVTHVSRGYVESLDTNAARYARAETGSCLADAGPYCRPGSSSTNGLGGSRSQPTSSERAAG